MLSEPFFHPLKDLNSIRKWKKIQANPIFLVMRHHKTDLNRLLGRIKKLYKIAPITVRENKTDLAKELREFVLYLSVRYIKDLEDLEEVMQAFNTDKDELIQIENDFDLIIKYEEAENLYLEGFVDQTLDGLYTSLTLQESLEDAHKNDLVKRFNTQMTTIQAQWLPKLNFLNIELSKIEHLIFNETTKIDKELQLKLKLDTEPKMVDYELKVQIGYYVEEADEALCVKTFTLKKISTLKTNKCFIADGQNHNEFQNPAFKNHPLFQQHHCYLFHDLYDHTDLDWKEIADINTIWWDIIPEQQYCTSLSENQNKDA